MNGSNLRNGGLPVTPEVDTNFITLNGTLYITTFLDVLSNSKGHFGSKINRLVLILISLKILMFTVVSKKLFIYNHKGYDYSIFTSVLGIHVVTF